MNNKHDKNINQVMNKYAIFGPFRLCRLKIKGRNVGYCKNQGLIDAITFIGEYRAPYEKNKSPYMRGVNFIRNAYERNYNEWISKAEIKRLMRPNYKRRHCLKIPSSSEGIIRHLSNDLYVFDGMLITKPVTLNSSCRYLSKNQSITSSI